MQNQVFALLAAAALCASPASAQTVRTVPAGGNLQTALDAARPGDTILLAAGATYVGNFVLPVKDGAEHITIRSASPDHLLPAEGERVDPRHAPLLAKLRSPNNAPAVATAAGAHHYRLLFLEFVANAGGAGDIIKFGDGSARQSSLAAVPYELIADRVYVHGDPAVGQKRGISLNSASTRIVNSYIADIKAVGQDSQAIAGWNGPGPFYIANNYLEGAGENVLFGGADPAIPDLVPSDITVVGNHLAKPLSWRGSRWVVKNLFELKSARRVTVDGNLFEYNWAAAQAGYAILLKSVNQDGGAPWNVVEHVQFTNNIVRHVSSAINILGRDPRHPVHELNHVTFRNNFFADVSGSRYGGVGRFILIQGGSHITFDHNTAVNDGTTTLYADGPAVTGFAFTNNVILNRGFAIKGGGTPAGNATLQRYFPGAQVAGNIVAGGSGAGYPSANHYPAVDEVGFVSFAAGDYRVSPSSPFAQAATDGSTPGCNFDALPAVRGTGTPLAAPSPLPASTPTPPPSGGATRLERPRGLAASVHGSTVTIRWAAPQSQRPAGYLLEVGAAPGAANVAQVTTTEPGLVASDVPNGVYYIRVRAGDSGGVTAPSEEIRVTVGDAMACETAPSPPATLRASGAQPHVQLTWDAPATGCTPTHYVVLVGSARGLADLAQATVTGSSLAATASPGTYFVRVVAVNAYGESAPSNEVVVRITR